MDAGDLEYASWALLMRVTYGFWAGVRLERLAEEIEHAVEFMRLHGMDAALQCTLPYQQLVRCLRGETRDSARLVAEDYDERAALEALRVVDFRSALVVLATNMQCARLFAGDSEAARAATDLVMEFQDGAAAVFYQCPMRVHGAMAELAAVRESGGDVEATLERVMPWREAVAATAAHNPHSGQHLLALFDAEVAAARGDVLEASVQYDRAIDAAAASGFMHQEALACERAAALHAARGAAKVAHAYLVEARRTWERYGATARVAALDAAYPDLRAGARRTARADVTAAETHSSHQLSLTALDLQSLLKASQAISEEIEFDRLLTRSMDVLVENVGARRGVLLLVHRGELRVEAIATADGTVTLMRGAPHDGSHAANAVVRRVWRTGAAEVHDDLVAERADDPYLRGREALSVLCTRVQHRGRPLGVLYFENDLVTAAFTADRVRILDVLAPQLGVSVRNARLLAAQSRFVPSQFIRSLDRKDIVDVEVGDHKVKEISVFFSDIWGYTPLVERLTAREALEFLNRYLSYAEPAITSGRGFIDTYLGDGIMALFDDADANAQDAVAAGVAFHRALDRYNDERRRNGERPVRTGVGINTGDVTLSTIGGQNSLKCGVVGDAVNLAARLEQLTRRSSCRLLISDATYRRLTNPRAFKLRRAGKVRVKGRTTPLDVFEVLDAEPEAVRDPRVRCLPIYDAALTAYYEARLYDALDGFTECVASAPGDPLARQFLQNTEGLIRDGLPEGWTGVESLTRR
jgi:class 3 adenylate cyclase